MQWVEILSDILWWQFYWSMDDKCWQLCLNATSEIIQPHWVLYSFTLLAIYFPFKILWLLSTSKPKCNFGNWSIMTFNLSLCLLRRKAHFWSVANVLRFGCAKQSENLERYLLSTIYLHENCYVHCTFCGSLLLDV